MRLCAAVFVVFAITSAAQAAEPVVAASPEAQKAMLASKSRGGDSGLQSVGKNHKPTHASGKQGPAEKKVRW